MLLGSTTASAAAQTITSSPLSITITDDLNCQVAHAGDTSFEWFPSAQATTGDCGTYLWAPNINGGQLFGPATGHARTFTPTAWVPVSQNLAGTTITTVVDTGAQGDPNCGLRITQTDTYTPGQERYRTTVAIGARTVLECSPATPLVAQSAAAAPRAPSSNILYRAGDCFLQNSDTGYGALPPTFGPPGSVYCRGVDANGDPGPRLEGFEPVTAGSNFVEDNFATVWDDINAKVQFPNTCTCAQNIDNGAGLSWNGAVAATSFVSDTVFSPLALAPSPSPTPTPSTPVLPRAGNVTPADSNGPAVLLAAGIVVVLLLVGVAMVRNRAT
jgi:hypothetical protein